MTQQVTRGMRSSIRSNWGLVQTQAQIRSGQDP